MRITTLIDNRPSPDDPQLVAEWGLSLCVELNGRHILVDMGASDAFARNAEHLSIDLAAIDVAILSHHHHDHGGGLRRFLELNDHADVYLGVAPDGDPTVKLLGCVRKYIGLDHALAARHAHRFRSVRERTEVLPGVFVLPRIVGHHARPAGNKFLYLKRDSVLVPDDFRHEIVVLPPFRGMSESESVVADIGRAVLDLRVETTYTGHCTGEKAFDVLRGAMGERVQAIHTGCRIDL